MVNYMDVSQKESKYTLLTANSVFLLLCPNSSLTLYKKNDCGCFWSLSIPESSKYIIIHICWRTSGRERIGNCIVLFDIRTHPTCACGTWESAFNKWHLGSIYSSGPWCLSPLGQFKAILWLFLYLCIKQELMHYVLALICLESKGILSIVRSHT
jgi:hypothetical protein